ncbi:MAG: hypothetical protein WBK20_02510 [Spirochaetota bacterium]
MKKYSSKEHKKKWLKRVSIGRSVNEMSSKTVVKLRQDEKNI